jgi:lipopolysaccharide/colanic/teichoic acid biosynthesis glycosyltransferase
MAISASRKGGTPGDTGHPIESARLNGTRPAALEVVRPKQRRGRSPVLSEEFFSHLLVTERKRSERSNRPFVLLSLKAKGVLLSPPKGHSEAALEALAAATRETDIVGWVKWPTVVGAIVSEIGAAEPAQAVETVRARVHRELSLRLDAKTLGDVSIECHVYPESSGGDSKSDSSRIDPGVDPLLHPDLHRDERERRFSDWIKRGLDVVASLALLLLLAPVLLVVATVVRLTSPGPILFRQRRLGKWGKPFKMLKFRTMYVNAGENPHYEFVTRFIKESGRGQTPAKNQVFKLTNDPRITPVGRILRKTSLDELPQLWNVLIGEMSLVGPRPPLPYELACYAPWHRRRILEAKPGITGLWQVMGRSRTTFDEMVRLDLRYARTRSFWTDLRILLRTPGAVVGGKGAR